MIWKKNKGMHFYVILLFGIIFSLGLVSSATSYGCCEKTLDGAWCQNAPLSQCDNSTSPETGERLRGSPTSCEASGYCRMGCCYNPGDGTCMENTPKIVCTSGGGVWSDKSAECDIPQCSLGCCLIGNQAAFVTQTRCSHLSAVNGLEVNYRSDITSEFACIASATSDNEGACVFEKDYVKTCLRTTKKECHERGAGERGSNVEFYEGYLCSAPELEADCGPSLQTTCVEGRDEVFFKDTCGNIANIYDANKIDKSEGGEDEYDFDDAYWTYIAGAQIFAGVKKRGVNIECTGGKDCGNCDYLSGTTCKEWKRGVGTKPEYGNYICKDLMCEYQGESFQHGETWCAKADGISTITIDDESVVLSEGEDVPGGRYFRLLCYDNEVLVEPCADYRQEVCIESEVGVVGGVRFKTAACKVNKWQDCNSQDNKQDCENTDRRDCTWLEGRSLLLDEEGNSLAVKSNGKRADAACVPRNPPGFDFWQEGDASDICSIGSTQCVVTYKKKGLGAFFHESFDTDEKDEDWKCDKNCECLPSGEEGYSSGEHATWLKKQSNLCQSLGDCGITENMLGKEGYNKKEDLVVA